MSLALLGISSSYEISLAQNDVEDGKAYSLAIEWLSYQRAERTEIENVIAAFAS